MAGYIACYEHSDNATKNKAAAMVKVTCQTDFAAKTEEFVSFCQRIAKLACGFQIEDTKAFLEIIENDFEDLAADLDALRTDLKENIEIAAIRVMKL
jgi:elongation factor Ts